MIATIGNKFDDVGVGPARRLVFCRKLAVQKLVDERRFSDPAVADENYFELKRRRVDMGIIELGSNAEENICRVSPGRFFVLFEFRSKLLSNASIQMSLRMIHHQFDKTISGVVRCRSRFGDWWTWSGLDGF